MGIAPTKARFSQSSPSAFKTLLPRDLSKSQSKARYMQAFDPKDKEPGMSNSNLWCDNCKMSNHSTTKFWKKMRCNKCNKLGHIVKMYKFQGNNQENFSEEKKNLEGLANIFYLCHSAKEEKEDTWYLDIGYTNHMTDNQLTSPMKQRHATNYSIFFSLDIIMPFNISISDASLNMVLK